MELNAGNTVPRDTHAPAIHLALVGDAKDVREQWSPIKDGDDIEKLEEVLAGVLVVLGESLEWNLVRWLSEACWRFRERVYSQPHASHYLSRSTLKCASFQWPAFQFHLQLRYRVVYCS